MNRQLITIKRATASHRSWWRAGVLAVMALVLVGCGSEGGSDKTANEISDSSGKAYEQTVEAETGFEEAARSLDSNSDGMISKDEWTAWGENQQTVYPEDASAIVTTFDALDFDQDGYLSAYDQAFTQYDQNGDGWISNAEWLSSNTEKSNRTLRHPTTRPFGSQETVRPSSAEAVSEETAIEFFSLADRSPADGQLSAEEFYQPPSGFERGDSDGDGQITEDEWQGSESVFDRLDSDDDGSITTEEFQALHALQDDVRDLAEDVSDTTRGSILSALDTDGDGSISSDEWRGSEERFTELDTDGDGVLSSEELSAAQPRNGGGSGFTISSTSTPQDIFDKLDEDSSAGLDSDEWKSTDELFTALDADSNNAVSADELLIVFQTLGMATTLTDEVIRNSLRELFQGWDTNEDGALTSDEWTGETTLFTALDTDSDSSLSPREVSALKKAIHRGKSHGPRGN